MAKVFYNTTKVFYAACKDGVKEVVRVSRKWWKDVQTGEVHLISTKKIFPTRESAEQAVLAQEKARKAKERAKKAREKRLKEEREREDRERDQIFKENPWLSAIGGVPFGLMLNYEIEYFVRRFKEEYVIPPELDQNGGFIRKDSI